MTFDCSCDYDSPQVYSSRMVRARKEYRCYECCTKINVGEQHEYAFGVYDGWTYQPRTCLSCVEIRQFVSINIPCFCWAHGNILDDATTAVQHAYEVAPDEVKGLAFGLGRLIVKARRARAAA